jgi:hypothetical protein
MNVRACIARALIGALCLSTVPAFAAEPDAAAKAEAAKRFDRGLQLFDEGDNAGALAEFKQTYATLPNPVVLYNIGLVYAAMGRPVDAVEALKQVAEDQSLSAAQRERAQKTLADQGARIGRLSITSNPPGARISVDGVDLATTPLSAPLQVATGTHVVGAVAEGYALARKEVVVAGNAEASLHFELVRSTARRDAKLTVHTRLSGAELFIDGKSVAKTPLESSLALAPGKHTVELRRPGYVTATQQVDLAEDASGEISLDPVIDKKALADDGVLFSLDIGATTNAELFVDQKHFGPYSGPVRLPAGPHRVRVEVAGYLPFERDVNLDPSLNNVLVTKREPTPETREAHVANVRFHRTWGWIGVGSGLLVGGGGAAWLALNSSTKSDARKELVTANAAAEAGNVDPHCNILGGVNTRDECQAYVDETKSELDAAERKDIIGYVGIGVGAALTVTGVVFLLTGEDADKFGSAPSSSTASRARWTLAAGPGDVGLGVLGSF